MQKIHTLLYKLSVHSFLKLLKVGSVYHVIQVTCLDPIEVMMVVQGHSTRSWNEEILLKAKICDLLLWSEPETLLESIAI